MKKDLLLMCQYFHPEYVSSATLPTELAEDLVGYGLQVDVICGYPIDYYTGSKVPKKENYKGICINRVKYTTFNNKTKLGRLVNFFSFFVSILMRLPFMFNYKVIIVYSNPPILPIIPYLISKLSKTKFIFVAYDIYPDSALLLGAIHKGSILERLMNGINNRVYQQASKIIVLGNEMKDYLIREKKTINAEKLVVIPNWYNGITTTADSKNYMLKDLRDTWSFIVLYSGNMGLSQDIDTILKGMLRFKNDNRILFLFAGHGSKVAEVEKFIDANGFNNALFIGFLHGEDYKDLLKISDLAIVSLEKGVEGIGVPSKTYGYFAAGKPVLAIMSENTDICRDIKGYNAGYQINQGDIDSFENVVNYSIYNVNEMKLKSENSRKIFEDLYKIDICTDKYYREVMDLMN